MPEGFDINNIPGAKLAEIGREVLRAVAAGGKQRVKVPLDRIIRSKLGARSDVVDYVSLKWLDDRVNEVCERGKI